MYCGHLWRAALFLVSCSSQTRGFKYVKAFCSPDASDTLISPWRRLWVFLTVCVFCLLSPRQTFVARNQSTFFSIKAIFYSERSVISQHRYSKHQNWPFLRPVDVFVSVRTFKILYFVFLSIRKYIFHNVEVKSLLTLSSQNISLTLFN